jgi:hypothetical protein
LKIKSRTGSRTPGRSHIAADAPNGGFKFTDAPPAGQPGQCGIMTEVIKIFTYLIFLNIPYILELRTLEISRTILNNVV